MDDNDLNSLKAQYKQPIIKKKSYKGRFIILAILIIIISASLAVGGLLLFKKKLSDTTTAPVATTTAGPKSSAVIDVIAADSAVSDATSYALFRTDSTIIDTGDVASVVYPHGGYSFVTNVSPDAGLKFTLKDRGTSSKAIITDVIKKSLIAAGYAETKQDVSALSAYKVTTYKNGGTVCQLVDYTATKLQGLEQSVICATDATLQASYANAYSLLAKADSAVPTATKVVSQATVVSGNKKLLTLAVTGTNGSGVTNYYYATLDKDFSYIGKRPTPSVDNADSYKISDELKKNISDSKWGTFLTDNIK